MRQKVLTPNYEARSEFHLDISRKQRWGYGMVNKSHLHTKHQCMTSTRRTDVTTTAYTLLCRYKLHEANLSAPSNTCLLSSSERLTSSLRTAQQTACTHIPACARCNTKHKYEDKSWQKNFTLTSTQNCVQKRKGLSHIRYWAFGPELIPVYRQSARRWP